MHRTCLEMLRRHPWVISMDCTYKTNQYGLPLLDIVGLASTGQTCYIAFAFVQDEKEDSYEIILRCLAEAYDSLDLAYPRTILTDKERALIKAIKTVFPGTKTISCIWHIEMNLLKKARPLLSDQIAIARRDRVSLVASLDLDPDEPTQSDRPKTKEQLQEELRTLVNQGWKKMLQRWNRVIYADSETALKQRWDWFKESYNDPIFQPVLAYIQAEWLDDCPEQFLHLHTSHYLHLGETATSRAEGAHWLLKKDLHTSANDLLVVLTSFERTINRQYANIQHTIATEQVRKAIKQSSLYTKLTYRISSRAIKHVESIRHHYLPEGQDKPLIQPICTCRSKETTGFPCIHLIKQYQDTHRSFEPELFHEQWHLYKLGEAPPINPLLLVCDPLPVRRRGRPRGAANFVQPSQPSNTQQRAQQSTQDTMFDRSTQRELSAFEYVLPPQERGRGRRGRRGAGPGRPPGRGRGCRQRGQERQDNIQGREGRGGRGGAVAERDRRMLRSSQRDQKRAE